MAAESRTRSTFGANGPEVSVRDDLDARAHERSGGTILVPEPSERAMRASPCNREHIAARVVRHHEVLGRVRPGAAPITERHRGALDLEPRRGREAGIECRDGTGHQEPGR